MIGNASIIIHWYASLINSMPLFPSRKGTTMKSRQKNTYAVMNARLFLLNKYNIMPNTTRISSPSA